jgi:S-adenosylmethionine-diacylglycerol 3-amino-3-carboxypropyl transferase
MSGTEIAAKAGFEAIRYAQLWEDGAVLCDAIGPRPGGTLVSIGSAGDNALSLLTLDPARVIAADLSAAQLAAIGLRLAAWPELSHGELLELMGSRESGRRGALLDRVLKACDADTAWFWDRLRPDVIAHGAGGVGKFERYFRLFRRYCLPLVHSRRMVEDVFSQRSREERRVFLEKRWNNRRWNLLLRLFFSRRAMGALGRDPAFFDHVDTSVPEHVARRIAHCFVENDPRENPYLHWILLGGHGEALPHAYEPANHALIRERLDRLELFHGAIEQVAARTTEVDGWNLSDIFEYMSDAGHEACYAAVVRASKPGARLVYWNMMAPRGLPPCCAGTVRARPDIAAPLAARDRAFFYSAFHVDEVL